MRMIRANDEGRTLYRLTAVAYVSNTGGPPIAAEPMLVVALNEANAKAAYAAALGYVPDTIQVENRGSADRTEIAVWGDTSRA